MAANPKLSDAQVARLYAADALGIWDMPACGRYDCPGRHVGVQDNPKGGA